MATTTSAAQGRTVVVRLSMIPRELRELVADEYVERAGLTGVPALELRLRAMVPREDPELEVPLEKWEAVMLGRKPKGDSIYRWLEGL